MTHYDVLIQARNYTPVKGPMRQIDWLVIHTMEAPEKPGTALAVAEWFAGPNAPQASAHYCIDDHAVIQCVRDEDIAWAAPGANSKGIHFEHAGFAAQTELQWADDYSKHVLEMSARKAASICSLYRIPIVKLEAANLIAGTRGICGHADITKAFHKSNHTDPGPHFPWADYLNQIAGFMAYPDGQETSGR